MEKMCSMCGQVKDQDKDFKLIIYKNGSRKPCINSYCNHCQRLYNKEYQRIYRERRRECER